MRCSLARTGGHRTVRCMREFLVWATRLLVTVARRVIDGVSAGRSFNHAVSGQPLPAPEADRGATINSPSTR